VVPTDGAAAAPSFGLFSTARYDKPDARNGALNETVDAPVRAFNAKPKQINHLSTAAGLAPALR